MVFGFLPKLDIDSGFLEVRENLRWVLPDISQAFIAPNTFASDTSLAWASLTSAIDFRLNVQASHFVVQS